ncbi:MAG: T9SS type A sorting domain-containing protein, partial [Ignavibacteria bacterium]|nr:T9SS type A sorting domain-containing protein [Ignavibacteria bacterium]
TVYTQEVYIPVGGGNNILLDSAENGLSRWTSSGGWGLSTSLPHSGTYSFSDSPTGSYSNTTTRSLTLTVPLNVSASPVLKLSYWYKHTIDTLDNAYVDISNDNGVTWTSPRYYNKTANSWIREVIDISSIAGGSTSLKIRFSLISNGSVTADGIYIDDIKLTGYNVTPTGIVNNNEIPAQYSLSQNYPNPFNPNTVINYQIKNQENVSIKIYDMLGKVVMTLVNENQTAGNYSVSFDGSRLSSGLYYYKLQSGDFSDTKKMLLVK